MRESNTKKQQQLEWRRTKIDELYVKGYSQSEIARKLEIDKGAVSRDLQYLKEQSKETIKNHISERLPYEYNVCLKGLQEIIKESWIIAEKADKRGDSREKLSSLALIKDSYSTKMELLTNASLLQDSVKWVEQTKEKLSSKDKEVNNNSNGLEGFTETNSRTEPAAAVF